MAWFRVPLIVAVATLSTLGVVSAEDKPHHVVALSAFKVETKISGVLEAPASTEIAIDPKEWATWTILEAAPHGTKVEAGAVVLRLQTDKLRHAVDEASATVQSLSLTVKQDELDLELLTAMQPIEKELAERVKAQVDEDAARYAEKEAVLSEKMAKQQARFSEIRVEDEKAELDQLEKMYKADDLTEETEEIVLKRARDSYEMAKFYLEYSQDRLDRELKLDLPRAKKAIEDSVRNAELTLKRATASQPIALERAKLDLAKSRHDLMQAQTKLGELIQDLEAAVVKAPVAGVVYYGKATGGKWPSATESAAKLRKGAPVQPNDVLMTIVGQGSPRVRGTVAEKDVAMVKVGVPGKATLTAYPKERTALQTVSVSEIPVAEGQFEVVLEAIEPWKGAVAAGMTCEASLIVYAKGDALSVPNKCVRIDDEADGARYVMILGEDGQATKRFVGVGHANADRTEIVSDLQPGEKVLIE